MLEVLKEESLREAGPRAVDERTGFEGGLTATELVQRRGELNDGML